MHGALLSPAAAPAGCVASCAGARTILERSAVCPRAAADHNARMHTESFHACIVRRHLHAWACGGSPPPATCPQGAGRGHVQQLGPRAPVDAAPPPAPSCKRRSSRNTSGAAYLVSLHDAQAARSSPCASAPLSRRTATRTRSPRSRYPAAQAAVHPGTAQTLTVAVRAAPGSL